MCVRQQNKTPSSFPKNSLFLGSSGSSGLLLDATIFSPSLSAQLKIIDKFFAIKEKFYRAVNFNNFLSRNNLGFFNGFFGSSLVI